MQRRWRRYSGSSTARNDAADEILGIPAAVGGWLSFVAAESDAAHTGCGGARAAGPLRRRAASPALSPRRSRPRSRACCSPCATLRSGSVTKATTQRSPAALELSASDDPRCRFDRGADPENGFSLEGTAAGHARVVAARALSDTALGGGVIGGSGNATTSVGVSASLNGGADWISDASAGGFAYALRTTLLRVAPRRVLATVVGVIGGVTTVMVDGAGGVNKPRLACVTSVLAPVTGDAAPDASFAAGTNNSSDDGDDPCHNSIVRYARGTHATGFERTGQHLSNPLPPNGRGIGAMAPRPMAWGGVRCALAGSLRCVARTLRSLGRYAFV